MKLTLAILNLALFVYSAPQIEVIDLTSAVDTAPTGSDIITNSGSVVQTGNGAHSTNDIKGTILRSFNLKTEGMESTSTFIKPEERPPQVFFNDPIITEKETLDIDEFGFSPFGFGI
ncbi:hypothetical protein CONCODRAFT_170038 [Conidiobolus coronatus NRRL 28638]|uniref:Uncharacterized protein n=1 Tax=Conidiobolus coronatus (strain ATCC 28846 / CBS 209.66 / NRRL 28638) TaxID=796925 RepID=A0A137NQL2_CONC2|nr:hypothetical protein CONCODRAFT_170038 [Conidiobolus coronatus NRRL 28638]|eukprot:KXN64960.1 hypothetical protein CONCODRAFT_170038 [Conidiobolus coronatus NRRL 28638]